MNLFPKILAIIPARKGSKGIPGKNMKLLGGKPLIQHTIEYALECKFLHNILVSSDCENILHFSSQFKRIETPFIRPAGLALDNTPAIEVLSHAIEFYRKQQKTFDCICLLQPTAPFRSKNLVHEAIMKMIESQSDCVVTVSKIPDEYNPNWAFHMNSEAQTSRVLKEEKLVSCRQELPQAFYRNGKVYMIKTELIRKGILLGGKITGLLCEPGINIDTPGDWEKAEYYIRNGATS